MIWLCEKQLVESTERISDLVVKHEPITGPLIAVSKYEIQIIAQLQKDITVIY